LRDARAHFTCTADGLRNSPADPRALRWGEPRRMPAGHRVLLRGSGMPFLVQGFRLAPADRGVPAGEPRGADPPSFQIAKSGPPRRSRAPSTRVAAVLSSATAPITPDFRLQRRPKRPPWRQSLIAGPPCRAGSSLLIRLPISSSWRTTPPRPRYVLVRGGCDYVSVGVAGSGRPPPATSPRMPRSTIKFRRHRRQLPKLKSMMRE